MTWIATGITVAGTLYGAYSSKASADAGANQSRIAGYSEVRSAALNNATLQQEALDIKQSARDQADQIKRASMQARGQILVAQSASGAVIGEGSAQAAMDQLDTLSSADALVALYSGVNAAASKRFQGRLGIQAGREKSNAFELEASSQEAAGDRAVLGGLLTAGAQLGGGYVKSTSAPATKK